MNLEMDFRRLGESVHHKDANHTEAELKYLIKTVPQFETDCKLNGTCKADADHVVKIAQWMLN